MAGFLWLFIAILCGLIMSRYFLHSLPRFVHIFVGPALGLIVVTEFTFILSLVFGFNQIIIFASLMILFGISIFLNFLKKAYPLTQTPVSNTLRSHWPLIIAALTIIPFAAFIFATKVLSPAPYGLTTGSGGLWADTAMHAGFTMSLVNQGLPPQNPLYAGRELVYPLLVNFLSAIMLKMDASLQWAFVLPQIIFFISFVGLFYLVGKKTIGNRGVFFAFLIFFLGWGLGFTQYLNQGIKNRTWTINQEYTHDYKTYHMHNILTGLIFPERSFLPGLVIGLLIAYLFANNYSKKETNPLISGFLLGILPLWHTHTFIFFTIATAFWYVMSFPRSAGSQLVQYFKNGVLFFLVTAIFALPALLWIKLNLTESFLHFSAGWIPNAGNFFTFWLVNTGLVIPLAIIGIFLLKNSKKAFFIPAFIIFIIANFVIFQPGEWDNIKLFSWVFLFLALLAGFALDRLFAKTFPLKILTLVILVSLIFSGTLSLIPFVNQTYTIYDNNDIDLADWINKNTPATAVFLTEPNPTQPVSGLTGRSVYVGYPGQLWVHGIPYNDREQMTRKILAGQIELVKTTEVPIDYLVVEKSKEVLFKELRESKLYENQKYAVFKINN